MLCRHLVFYQKHALAYVCNILHRPGEEVRSKLVPMYKYAAWSPSHSINTCPLNGVFS